METVMALQREKVASVLGNHDLMVLGRLPLESCGPRARRAVEWTATELSPAERAYLERLPLEIHREPGLLFVHSTAGDTATRLGTPLQFATERRSLLQRYSGLSICFTGHTHVQQVTEVSATGKITVHAGTEIPLTEPSSLYFVNPGTVGEPRGNDLRAAYAIFDDESRTVTFHMVAYDRTRLVQENVRRGLMRGSRRSIVTRVRGLVKLAATLLPARAS
jgi:predicted phosphodiesterase